MHLPTIFKVLGMLLILFSFTMLPPVLVDWFYQEHTAIPFLAGFGITFTAGLGIWLPCRHQKRELRTRDGFIIVVLFWVVLCGIGALPFIIAPHPQMSLTDAVFESVSGITTTGATVLDGLDSLPHAILYYRQQLQLLGALGIIILAVAILPMLGVGGMQLFRAESTGPVKDNKLTPRITETAKALWKIYLVLTALCIGAYWIAGMGLFDAVSYGYSTMATGGFAPYDASLGQFDATSFKAIAITFMLISAISFPLHFAVFSRRKPSSYWQDEEVRIFFALLLAGLFLVSFILFFSSPRLPFIDGLFHLVSFATTTGLVVSDYQLLPGLVPLFLLFMGVIGGCAGSTTGGIKVIRFILLQKQGQREIKRLIHPQGRFVIQFDEQPVSSKIIESVWGFLAVFVALFSLFLLLLLIVEQDFMTAYTTVIACFTNIGPALGEAVDNYAGLHVFSKWVLSFAMLTGRLEMFTLLVILSPAFWRH